MDISNNQLENIDELTKLRNLKAVYLGGNNLVEFSEKHYPVILKEQNNKSRKELIKIAGLNNIIEFSGNDFFCHNPYYRMFNLNLSVYDGKSREYKIKPRPYLEVTNPETLEKDFNIVCSKVKEHFAQQAE